MITVFAILMLLYNMWLVFYLVTERRHSAQEEAPPQKEKTKQTEKVEDTGIVGKSNFKMPSKVPPTVPNTAIAEEGEAVDEEDITFAEETDGQTSEDLTKEELAEIFSDHRGSNIQGDDDWDEEDMQVEGYASGASFEDIDTAVRTVKKERPTKEEKLQAGQVFTQIKDSELIETLKERQASLGRRIMDLIDTYIENPTLRTAVAPKPFKLPDNVEDFDIRDYV